MKANKSCKTCESNMRGECANVHYGEPVPNIKDCDGWDYSLDYFEKLVDGLPEDIQKRIASYDPRINVHEVLKKYYENL
jgi:hypothetical protein